jgi:hypothetical protein
MEGTMWLGRAVTLVILVTWAGGLPRAEDFWGHKLERQPTQFIFGYGSLINTRSRDSTAANSVAAIPARVSAAFGYIRTWNDRSPSGFIALGLRRAGPGETGMTINGVVYPVEGTDMSAFDAREKGYIRVEVPRQDLEAVSWQAIPSEGKIWAYVPEQGSRPNAEYPLLQSYIDVVIEGGLEYGPDFAREIIQTTTGWSEYWLNDRRLARRPWVFDSLYQQVDELLAAQAPHFADRAFPEAYTARFLLQKAPPAVLAR